MAYDYQTVAVYDEKAEDYLKLVDTAENDPALANFLAKLPAGGMVLDLGCGPGNYAAVMQKNGFKAVATDASSVMVEMASKYEGVEAYQSTFDDLKDNAVYDGIWANFSLLHAARADFPIHLNQIAAALKFGGYLHLGMKTGVNEQRDKIGRHYAYYSSQELREHLLKAGLQVEDEVCGEAMGMTGQVEPWIVMTAVRT